MPLAHATLVESPLTGVIGVELSPDVSVSALRRSSTVIATVVDVPSPVVAVIVALPAAFATA